MKNILVLALGLFTTSIFAQVQNPVSWKATFQKTSSTEGEIIITATIEKNWHTYSQKAVSDGPIPTSFTYTPVKGYELVGNTEESQAHEEFVPAFGVKIFIYTDSAEFKQKVKITGKSSLTIPVQVEYMSCNDMMCLPPKIVDLSVKTQ